MKMTIHRGLAELKLIDSKIEKTISQMNPVGSKQKGQKINGLIDEGDFSKDAISRYKSIVDLIERKLTIKSAIVLKNAETQVTVGAKEMSIADAISFKSNIGLKVKLLDKLKSSLTKATMSVNKGNEQVESNALQIMTHVAGGDSKENESINKVGETYKQNNSFSLFDPINVTEKIEKLESEISDFNMEIDAALSEINAVTFIEI